MTIYQFRINITHYLLLLLLALLVACNGKHKAVKQKIDKKKDLIDTAALFVDTADINKFISGYAEFSEFAPEFDSFYKSRNYHYAWFDSQGLIEAAQHLAGHIQAQENEGVLKKLPHKEELLRLIDQQIELKSRIPSKTLDLMLTAEYFNYAKNRWGGAELGNAKDLGWYLPGKKLSYSELLTKQLKGSAVDVEQEAVIPQYIALRKMLNRYQQIDKREKDVIVPLNDTLKNLKIGDSLSVVTDLRKRLFQLGDLSQLSGTIVYDQQLADAVVKFKKRHGIQPDEVLSAKFIKELNISLQQRIQQMMINLERMRWIPLGDHGGKFILVNIPAYQLYFYENEQLVWGCKVVVGKEMSQTVIFGGNLQYVVFSPYWYVPQSIIKKEVLPAINKDPDYLAKHRMEWNNGQVRQKPGADNSLGLVKFIFPNANDIYLHDTPSKPLFKEEVRAFSHGCIRVEQPKELAKRLLDNMPVWTSAKIDKAMHAGREQWITLKTKVPVYIGYFTAYVDSAGELNFRDDIYDRDSRLLNMLMK